MKEKKLTKAQKRHLRILREKAHAETERCYGIKISHAILKICDHLMKKFREPHRQETAVRLGVIAWNLAVIPNGYDRKQIDGLLRSYIGDAPDADFDVIHRIFEEMIDIKNDMFPQIREIVIDYKVTNEDGIITLSVKSMRLDA